jgi:hypothetical protein
MTARQRKAILTVTIVMVLGFALLIAPSFYTGPTVAYHEGIPSEILNCESPAPENVHRCAALYCERALYERKVVRPFLRIALSKSQFNFSDAPRRSVHFHSWTEDERKLIARCEMKDYDVVSIEFVDRLP